MALTGAQVVWVEKVEKRLTCPALQSYQGPEYHGALGSEGGAFQRKRITMAVPKFCVYVHLYSVSARCTCTRLLLPYGQSQTPRLGSTTAGSTPSTNLQDQLHHLSVHQSMHRLPVDMSDEVALTKPRLTGWTSILHVLPQGENSYQPGARA